ncbi:MAG: homoserine dehydrogenase [Chryseotalea sp. WA131a]|nr:MAG: homoserine dehydrogenase [Chryseotalea sp. WA131a]
MKRGFNLGMFGFGGVGQGLYHMLHETAGIKAAIKKICVKNEKQRMIPASRLTFDSCDILFDPKIDIVVELINDADAAFSIVKTALEQGKAVVTANNKMLSEHIEEIYLLQRRHGKPVLYEGAVCGSIPILRNLEEYCNNDHLISSIAGIFNSPTNYILTKIFEEKISYSEALAAVQRLGFAESDPTLVSGYDPKYKLVIAIAHTFGLFVNPEDIISIGINKISGLDLKFASENNYTIKLIARAFRDGEKVYGFVAPQFLEKTDEFATVRNEFNAVQIKGVFSESLLFIGKGAGCYPTGSAVMSDISALAYDYRYEYRKHHQGLSVQFSNDLCVEVFISFQNPGELVPGDFVEFMSGYAFQGNQYMRGSIMLEKLLTLSKERSVGIILCPKTTQFPVSVEKLALV